MKIAVFLKTCARAGIPVLESFIKSISEEDYKIYEEAHPLGKGGGHAGGHLWGKFAARSAL